MGFPVMTNDSGCQRVGSLSIMALPKLDLPDLEPPVTVVGAMNCGDYLLLAADSHVTDTKITRLVKKLDMSPERPVAWGFAGAEDVGSDFGEWLRSYDWSRTDDWRRFRDVAANELSGLNGNKRRLMRRAHAKPQDADAADVLIAGYINGQPQFLVLDSKGGHIFLLHTGFTAVGTGGPHAEIAYHTVMAFTDGSFPHTVENMGQLMFIAASLAPNCQPPIRVIRITPEGASDVRPGGDSVTVS